ncbi:RagB/SusD family nutrient uptake outer membrane protein [Sphingobacterium sp. ML3W]|uniref:RagB/SusD family nutrient uptake outer membrane protein n=1 Tax=Sphingobacterium sp. ML3W TaxID=1538644 RepID=UPI00249A108E|nr:RagB/SusD family nutrient uptake outer membrane protein [Sphingobacterium sp. ML3W]WFA81353.1 RagB/SusD family nutrient uptake outer membrane protein [Sphingobacterium sp. ML3W]
MRRIIKVKISYILSVMLLCTTGCSTDFLNITPRNAFSDETIWQDPVLAEKFISDIYNAFDATNSGFTEQMQASATDESLWNHTDAFLLLNTGAINGANQGWSGTSRWWERMYTYIRFSNIAVEKLTDDTKNGIKDQPAKDKLLAQAYFIRAYCYHQLLRYYGGVPLIINSYEYSEDPTVYKKERATYEACVNQIIQDCDESYKRLGGVKLEKGRVNALAILALKSRTLIYAASDLHDSKKLTTKVSDLGDIADKLPLLAYTSGSQQERYRLAQAAAKAAMDAGAGYKLNLTEPVSVNQGITNYKSIAMGGGSKAAGIDVTAAADVIFARYFITEQSSSHARDNGPNGYSSWGGNQPLGLLVDDYEMSDGTKFDWNNPVHKTAPYKNRDPRFYASILYDGADWKPRNNAADPANQIQTGTYDLLVGGNLTKFSGLDTKQAPRESHNGTWTGYYIGKFIDPDPDIIDAQARQYVPWPYFRYTELVFNYVEASIELGETEIAKTWLNKIRFRAGMPAITATDQNTLRKIYRHERRIEMAYEQQRFFDARRWLIADETLGRKVTIVKVDATFKPGKSLANTYKHDESIYDYNYTPQEFNTKENRIWKNQLYFIPLSRDEIRKNPLLVQNPGYVE